MSLGEREKKATSEPETNAEHNSKSRRVGPSHAMVHRENRKKLNGMRYSIKRAGSGSKV